MERYLQRATDALSYADPYRRRQEKLTRVGASSLEALVLAPGLLVRSGAYTMPVTRGLALVGGVTSLRPHESALSFELLPPGDTLGIVFLQSEVQAERIASSHRNNLLEGWEWLRMGKYLRSRGAFANAETCDRGDPAPRLGQTVVNLVLANYTTAGRLLLQSLRRDGSAAFGVQVELPDLLGDRDRWRQLNVAVEYRVLQFPDHGETKALWAYVLWYGGDREEAMRVANQIPHIDPSSEFASIRLAPRIGEVAPSSNYVSMVSLMGSVSVAAGETLPQVVK